jgi:hypothetical protein
MRAMRKGWVPTLNGQADRRESASKPPQETEYDAVFDPLKPALQVRMTVAEMLEKRL